MKKNIKKKLKPCMKRDKKYIKFDDTEIEKHKFQQHFSLILIVKILIK